MQLLPPRGTSGPLAAAAQNSGQNDPKRRAHTSRQKEPLIVKGLFPNELTYLHASRQFLYCSVVDEYRSRLRPRRISTVSSAQ